MRFSVTPAQLKKLAHRVHAWMPGTQHAQLLDVLSRGLGWRDWHEVISTPPEIAGQGAPFPLAINAALDTVGHVRDLKFHDYRRQMHQAFVDAYGETYPAVVDDDTSLFALLDTVGCTDNPVSTLKAVREGLPSASIRSPFYRLSLSDVLGLDQQDFGLYDYSEPVDDEQWGVRRCHGAEVDPEENMGAVDPCLLLSQNQYIRWLETVTRHSFDEADRRAGYSREPFCLVCEVVDTQVAHGMVMGAWEVQCPAEQPQYVGTFHLLAAASYSKQAEWMLSAALPNVLSGAIDSALKGLVGCPDAQVVVRVRNDHPTRQSKPIALATYEMLSDHLSLSPCLRAGRARLELLERHGSGARVVAKIHSDLDKRAMQSRR